MKALQIDEFGPLENLRIRDVPDPPLPRDCVRIRVEAAGVNPSDAGVALGRFPQTTLPRILGRDFAGTIVEGPREFLNMPVWGSGGGELGMTRDGSHAEQLVLPVIAAIRRPSHLSPESAAVVGVPYVTAWSALVELAGFKANETVVVSGAAGAVGSAAVALASALGGRAIALVRSADNLAPLEKLAPAAILRSGSDDVPQAVRELTSGRGAEVALNAVGAPVFGPLFDALAKGGRMVVFSARGGREAHLDLFALYRRELQLFGLDTAAMSLEEVASIYAKLNPYFESRQVWPSAVAQRFGLSRARDAYERIESGSGKIVLIPDA
ncbi:MAG TPA: zinc-binding alcohol dehydrogenase family protein [Candidatus Babeliales bacterium]|nr:zinc-binding alcohol dehydrogenase family protein [Candidatus Babeliales bacterium]